MRVLKNYFKRGFTRMVSNADLCGYKSSVIREQNLRQSALKKAFFVLFISLLFVVTTLFLKIPLFVAVAVAEGQTVIEYTSSNERDPLEDLIIKERERSQIAGQEGIGEGEATVEINLPQLSIKGIIWDTPIPQAIIDDRIVKIGDMVKEAKVIDINKEGVTLLFQNKRFIITTETRNQE